MVMAESWGPVDPGVAINRRNGWQRKTPRQSSKFFWKVLLRVARSSSTGGYKFSFVVVAVIGGVW